MNRFSLFKQYLQSDSLTFVMEAHNALSAKIAQRAGFKALWASSLTISAANGARDCNELSWTQVLDVVDYMVDTTEIPIMLDGDTGYGDYNNVRRLVKKLCQMHVAAVCLEDKVFPKTNSFIDRHQHLAAINEFSNKIKAGKDAQTHEDFSLVARTEALICKKGISEALDRAYAYYSAGADAILIHSKKTSADEIFEFADAWRNTCPLVIVPTTYYTTPTQLFVDHNISMVIWANHNLRASIQAMQVLCKQLIDKEHLISIEDTIAPLSDVFDLVDQEELNALDVLYMQKAVEKVVHE